MLYQLISVSDEPGKTKFPGLISLPMKGKESDKLFDSYWGANMIRPKKNLSSDELNKFIEQSNEILVTLRKELTNVILIDFKIDDDLASDVDITYQNYISPKLIEPVLNNFEFSSVNYSENGKKISTLVSKVSSVEDGIHAFCCTIARKTFLENSIPDGIKLFEETKIFSSLAAKGRL